MRGSLFYSLPCKYFCSDLVFWSKYSWISTSVVSAFPLFIDIHRLCTSTHTHTHTHTGEGRFGLVLQAKAEGIVEGSPERNIVAMKTVRGKHEMASSSLRGKNHL